MEEEEESGGDGESRTKNPSSLFLFLSCVSISHSHFFCNLAARGEGRKFAAGEENKEQKSCGIRGIQVPTFKSTGRILSWASPDQCSPPLLSYLLMYFLTGRTSAAVEKNEKSGE